MKTNASLYRRFAASLYELLSLIAIWLFLTAIYLWLFGSIASAEKRLGLQLFLWFSTGAYFVLCWLRSGQTLATQAWKIKLVNHEDKTLTLTQGFMRYALASISFMLFGLGFLWALFDKNKIFLHDRILNTRLVHEP